MSARKATTERTVEVQGMNLHCLTWGERTSVDRHVLLIHGLTHSSRSWSRLGPVLAARGWFAIAPDLRGRGRSDAPTHGYGVPHHAYDMLEICDAFGMSSARLVGHSLGAQICLYLAAIYPDRVDRMVLLDAGGAFPADTMQAIAASLARLDTVYPSLDAYLETMRRNPIHEWSDFWEQFYRYDAKEHTDGSVTSRVSRNTIDEEIRVLEAALDLDRLAENIDVPTLILRATVGLLGPEQGQVLTVEGANRLAHVIPNSRVVQIPGANHYTALVSDIPLREIPAFLEENVEAAPGSA